MNNDAEDRAAGLLYVDGLLLASRFTDGLVLTSAVSGWTCTATGVFAEAALDHLRGTARHRHRQRLAGLGEAHPLVRAVSWATQFDPLPLEPSAALRLDGFSTLFIELTGACDERCVHCYTESDPQQREGLDRATCERLLEDAAALGFERIQLTGGDPLLCPFLPQLTERAAALGLPWCEVYTNGLRLDGRLLARLDPEHVCFAFSFHAADPPVHDAITRTPGSHSRTACAIRHAIDAGFLVRAAIIAMQQNAGQISQTVSLLAELGVPRSQIGVASSHAVGRGTHYSGEVPAVEADDSTARGRRDGDRRAKRGKLCVTYRGEVVPCIFNRQDVLGRLGPNRSLRQIVASPQLPPPLAAGKDDSAELGRSLQQLQCPSCRLTALALRRCAAVR